jgi:MerR family transcriptional regulator, copper efflux regulator
MNIRELSKLTGTPERQIRYMIAGGFVPPPEGGRAYADYGDDHVAAIRRYLKLRQQGFPPQAIKVLLAGGKTAPFPVMPGITLQIDPELLVGDFDGDVLAGRIRKAVVAVLKDQSDAPHHLAVRKRSR